MRSQHKRGLYALAKMHFNNQEYDSQKAMPSEVWLLYQMMTNMIAGAKLGLEGVADAIASARWDHQRGRIRGYREQLT